MYILLYFLCFCVPGSVSVWLYSIWQRNDLRIQIEFQIKQMVKFDANLPEHSINDRTLNTHRKLKTQFSCIVLFQEQKDCNKILFQ